MMQLILWFLALPAWLKRRCGRPAPSPAAPVAVADVAPASQAPEEDAAGIEEGAAVGGVTAAALAARVGLSIEPDEGVGGWRWRRHDAVWSGAPDPYAVIDQAGARRAVWAEAVGVRMGLDTLKVVWTPEVERPEAPERIFRKEDVPSPYGERLPWLVPAEALGVWRVITGREPVEQPWHDAMSRVAYVLEIGSLWHVLSEEEAACSLGTKRIVEDARRAWFYDSYKAWAHARKLDVGVLRVYETQDGLGAGRALLLPELDWDAARARGFAATPTRDALWVLEPAAGIEREVARSTFEALVRACYEAAEWPMSPALLEIEEAGIRAANTDGRVEHPSQAAERGAQTNETSEQADDAE
jgi:hypothetical protein